MITITIEGNTADYIRKEMARLLGAGEAPPSGEYPKLGEPVDVTGSVSFGDQQASTAQAETKPDEPQPAPTTRKRRTKAEMAAAAKPQEPAQISTGEARVGPEDTPEDQAQDVADETAEAPTQTVLTHDSVRNALSAYVKKFGMAAAQEDGPKLLALAFPQGGIVKISDIPLVQNDLQRVVNGVNEMVAKNPYQRTAVS